MKGKNMSIEEVAKYVSRELCQGKDAESKCSVNGVIYKIEFLAESSSKGINIPSILAIPMSENITDRIILEANNLESENTQEVIEQGIQTGIKLARLISDFPSAIVIPLIPSFKNYPYLQQLSLECFNIPVSDKNYRMDEQVVRIIDAAKSILKNEIGLTVREKIFLNGYSSSGVFAQRFSLLHPDIVDTVCIGGASGSIPIPTEKLAYPLGIANYESLTGREFDLESYSKIKFRYYVSEFETQNKSAARFDDLGRYAPMHDMSCFDRSIPTEVGKYQRELLGTEMFSRAENTIRILQNLGIDIQHKIILGANHGNIDGVILKECWYEYINDICKDNSEVKKTSI